MKKNTSDNPQGFPHTTVTSYLIDIYVIKPYGSLFLEITRFYVLLSVCFTNFNAL